MAVFTIKEVEEEASKRIAALDGSVFNQGQTIKGTWREATIPLSVTDDAAPLAHLMFNTWVESARNTGMAEDVDGQVARIASDLVVLFTYHVRPGKQIFDQREASQAALQIVTALMALPQNNMVVTLINAFRPALTPDGEWMLIRVDFVALHDIRV